ALACSAFFRTTAGAFIWSYLLAAIMFFSPGLLWLILWSVTGISVTELHRYFGPGLFEWTEFLVFPFFGPAAFFGPRLPGVARLGQISAHSILVLGASAVFLVTARLCVVRRAFLPSRNVMLNVFQVLDRTFLRLNNNPLTRGLVFVGDTAPLPGDRPVAWRETAKRSLGKARYLLRVFLAIEIPVATLCLMLVFADMSAEPITPLL